MTVNNYRYFRRAAGEVYWKLSQKYLLTQPADCDDNFLLGVTHATGLCKGFGIASGEYSEPAKGA